MPRIDRDKVSREIREKISSTIDPRDALPMPHEGESRVSVSEWEEYQQRRALYRRGKPGYEAGFGRPSDSTVGAVWDLMPSLSHQSSDLLPDWVRSSSWLRKEEKRSLEQEAKRAFVIALDTFIAAGLAGRQVTYNRIFDALCRRYSDHHRQSKASIVRDMSKETAGRCRRDLLLNGVEINKLWGLLTRKWPGNPLFQTRQTAFDGQGVATRVMLNRCDALEAIVEVLGADGQYARPDVPGIRVRFDSGEATAKPLSKAQEKYEVCADVPYNVVKLGEKSKELLRIQSEARLVFDTSSFKRDYQESCDQARGIFEQLQSEYGIDATLPNGKRRFHEKQGANGSRNISIWSVREKHLFYRAVEEGLRQGKPDQILAEAESALANPVVLKKYERHCQEYAQWRRANGCRHGRPQDIPSPKELKVAELATREWRQNARHLLAQYDRATRHIREWRRVYEQLSDHQGCHLISSGFERTINRRYQPTDFWPSFVTSKSSSASLTDPFSVDAFSDDAGSEEEHSSYRRRWFKARDTETEELTDLVGVDISSSQTQIIATLLGIEELEELTMFSSMDKPPFKAVMAQWAWNKHLDPEDAFELNQGSSLVLDYAGPDDRRLQELVKALWMRRSYGSNARSIVRDQRDDPRTYGPGWTENNARRFLAYLHGQFPQVMDFLTACRKIATISCKRDPAAGVSFTDPSDGATVRWNPVARADYKYANNGCKLILSLPGEARNGAFKVDRSALARMIAPCLVHMLDAFYSTLVMEKLAQRGVRNFVGIHDCWLVPEKVRENGQERDGAEVLVEAMNEAAGQWYAGLHTVYEDLLKYLKEDERFGEMIQAAYQKWQQRMNEGYTPRFHAKKE